jgi:hypothetical protein
MKGVFHRGDGGKNLWRRQHFFFPIGVEEVRHSQSCFYQAVRLHNSMESIVIAIFIIAGEKVKGVKFALEQAIKAQRGSSGIALLFL